MKKLIAALAMVALMAGCASNTPQQKGLSALNEVQKIKTDYIKDKKIAGIGKGTSSDEMVAYNIAAQEARLDVANTLDARIKGFTERFTEQVNVADKESLAQHFENASKTKVDQHLTGATITDIRTEVTPDGKYVVYGVMVLDVNLVDELINSMKETASNLNDAEIQKVREMANKAYAELD